jgi:hypothetical protein
MITASLLGYAIINTSTNNVVKSMVISYFLIMPLCFLNDIQASIN